MTIRCPDCGTGQRVPYRTHANTGPVPEHRHPAPRPTRSRPEPAWRPTPSRADPWEDERPPAAPMWPSGGLAGVLAALRSRTAPTPAAPRPAAPAPANRPAYAPPPIPAPSVRPGRAGVQPIDPQTLPERDLRRRDDVCQIAGSLSTGMGLRVWYNQPPGLCEAMDTTQPRDRQRCPQTATHAVRFQRDVTEADAYTCPSHARPLAAIADRAQYIAATVYPLR